MGRLYLRLFLNIMNMVASVVTSSHKGRQGFFVVVYQQGVQDMHADTEVYNTEMSFSPIYLFL